MRLLEAPVDRYGPLGGWDPHFTRGLTVLSGPNEAGKTLYLEALLRLMDSGVEDVLDPPPRFQREPTGRVIIESGSERYELGVDGSLSELTPIQPADLPTVFVVRDNDLAMPEGPSYYTDLVEHLGEIHSSAIEGIVDELKAAGRLTATRLDLSDQVDDAKSTRRDAAAVHDAIEAFLADVQDAGITTHQRERIQLERDLRMTRSALAVQRAAQTLDEYERLRSVLTEYERDVATLTELAPYTRDTLETLQRGRRELDRSMEAITEIEEEIDEYEHEMTNLQRDKEATEEEVRRFERREADANRAVERLDEFRRRSGNVVGADRRATIGMRATVAGLVSTGLLGVGGAAFGSSEAMVLAVVVFVTTAGAGIVTYLATRQLDAIEGFENETLEAARDAGFDPETIEDVGPAIEMFRGDLDSARARLVRIEAHIESIAGDLSASRAERDRLTASMNERQQRHAQELASAEVERVAEFEDRVKKREHLLTERDLAEQRLRDAFGDPDPSADPIETFTRRLSDMRASVEEDDIDADAFDEGYLSKFEDRVDALEVRQAELSTELGRFDERVEEFRASVRALDTHPFTDEQLTIPGRSIAALRTVQHELEALIDTIDRDAELSRKAIDIFEEIAAEEEQKLTELFTPDGAASRAFAQITDGRYERIDYDPDAGRLVVERSDGQTVAPSSLSEGTADQLYLASRLSLAERLLEGEPGFLLLDDPLVGADPGRLRRGFETLLGLAADGWQIVYLTAKAEVWADMVDAFDLAHERLDSIV